PPPPLQDELTPTQTEGAATKLLILANGCWFGGIWSDAEGREPPESKRADIEARCKDVLKGIYGDAGADDKAKLEQLRAFDASAVGDLAAKVDSLAKDDTKDGPRREALVSVLKASAAAQREAMLARRAAEKVKRDVDKEPAKLTSEEVEAVGPVSATKDLEALLGIDDPDARAIAYITAMDRIAISRGLPKHLKIYSLAGTMKALFGTPPPALPADVTKAPKKGTYLAYVTDVAKAAGHAVPDTAKTPKQKEALAWAGVLAGVADRIKSSADKLPEDSHFRALSQRIAQRLTFWYEAETKAAESKKPAPKK
ncbi:MAG TPA: hypothetical protein VIF62_28895, partial [Labilithrix sp.]